MSAHPSARALRAHGVVFVRDALHRVVALRGPTAVARAAAREVARRAAIFAPQLRALGAPAPALPGVGDVPRRRGLCLHCGEPLEAPQTDGGCDVCHAAIWRVLREGDGHAA